MDVAFAVTDRGVTDIDKARDRRECGLDADGHAIGAVLSGMMMQYLAQPTHLVYAVLAAIYIVQAR